SEHLPVFACSMGDNAIHYLGHVKMMAAVQPFISGAISKTVNMPEDVSVEDVEQLHIDAWKMGLKAIAIYRDNCKVAQPLAMAKKDAVGQAATQNENRIIVNGPARRKLPKMRTSKTYKFQIADLDGYFTVGEYEDGKPGELFINVSKQGSTLRGLMDSFAISVSLGLQYGVPLKHYVRILRGTSFAPAGATDDSEIKTASSITDYILRRLALDYLSFDDQLELGLVDLSGLEASLAQTTLIAESNKPAEAESKPQIVEVDVESRVEVKEVGIDQSAPLCYNCGNITQRSGSCYVCSSCGSTTGCS
ncbi:vitamin B12-dependent ribonucleotide reductase, partial [Patescibacteria group bacterium]|nr:vitamin B12-dependent ribonucleotide reductase [Patescibacteria group bacterium]